MDEAEPLESLLQALALALGDGSFVKLTLSKGQGGWQRADARLVEIRGAPCLSMLTRRDGAADDTANHAIADAPAVVRALLAAHFGNAHLFTTAADLELRSNRRGERRLFRHQPTQAVGGPTPHNRERRYVLDPRQAPWLRALGVVDGDGKVKHDKADKYRQLQNILKILDDVLERAQLPERPRVVDMGCGKGYLTFALYDWLRHYRKREAEVVGVDRNAALMTLCNRVAGEVGYGGLSFVCGDVDSFAAERIDVLIALHACDIATDTAIYKGIAAGAAIIVAVPCCQKELRPQLTPPVDERPIFKHDTFRDRFAQTLTDALRGLYLESRGYRTRIMEFISDAHTHRNVMIVGVRGDDYHPGARIADEIATLKARYGIQRHHLETLLAGAEPR